MKKIFVLAMMTLLTATAHATTLTVTEGDLTLFGTDKFAGFSGDGFSVHMISPFGVNTGQAFGVGIASITVGFPGGDSGSLTVQVGASSCTFPFSLDCGTITVTSPRLESRPADWPINVPFIATAPFFATGHLNVGDGFDFVGQGVLTGVICFIDCPPGFFALGGPGLEYTFGVPEPPSLLLLAGAVLAIAGMIPIVRGRQMGSGSVIDNLTIAVRRSGPK